MNNKGFKKGDIPWNKNKKWDQEIKNKIGKANIRKKRSEIFKRKRSIM